MCMSKEMAVELGQVIGKMEEVDRGVTGVYGSPESDQKRHTWELLRRLATLASLLWLCFGDLMRC